MDEIIWLFKKDLGWYNLRYNNKLMNIADKKLINQIIDEVLLRDNLYESKKDQFIKKLSHFRERYDV